MIFEVCTGSYEDVLIAKKAGADRVELNSALFLGGLTPSLGTFKLIKKYIDIKVMVMIRPRSSGFCYTDYEYGCMKEDANIFIENGADGIVFGFLKKDQSIDKNRVEEFVKISKGKDTIFHRAFDITKDPIGALCDLIDCGVKRVLTSGQKPSAYEGMDLIKELVLKASNRIEILPGSGINEKNAKEIVEYTGACEIHFSARELKQDSMILNSRIDFVDVSSIKEDLISITSEEKIKNIMRSFK